MSPIDFFKAHIAELAPRGNSLYLGQCPNCQRKEFRVFDTDPIEWRCGGCRLSGWGIEAFMEAIGKNRLSRLPQKPRNQARQKANQRASLPEKPLFTPLNPKKAPEITPAEAITPEAGAEVPATEPLRMLSNGHPKRIGPAIWVWLHLNDQVKGSYKDREGRKWGIVKPPSLQQFIVESALILDQSERNIRNHLNRLKRHDYIRILRDTEEIHIINLETSCTSLSQPRCKCTEVANHGKSAKP